MTVRSVLRLAALLLLSACLAACTANPALEESRQAFASGNAEAALRSLRDKVVADPRNLELRSYYLRQRDMLVVRQLALAQPLRQAIARPRKLRCVIQRDEAFHARAPEDQLHIV